MSSDSESEDEILDEMRDFITKSDDESDLASSSDEESLSDVDTSSEEVVVIPVRDRSSRQRKPVERYIDSDAMKLYLKDVPEEEVEQVFNEDDEYFNEKFDANQIESEDEENDGAFEEDDVCAGERI